MALSASICIMAFRIELGNIHNPGPGLIPFGVAALLGLMSVGLSIRSLIKSIKGDQKKEVFKGIAWRKLVMTLISAPRMKVMRFAFEWKHELSLSLKYDIKLIDIRK